MCSAMETGFSRPNQHMMKDTWLLVTQDRVKTENEEGFILTDGIC